jgi:hypothetical protein
MDADDLRRREARAYRKYRAAFRSNVRDKKARAFAHDWLGLREAREEKEAPDGREEQPQ